MKSPKQPKLKVCGRIFYLILVFTGIWLYFGNFFPNVGLIIHQELIITSQFVTDMRGINNSHPFVAFVRAPKSTFI